MKVAQGTGKPFDMELDGQTVEAHGVMVTPVARVRGQASAKDGERGKWRFAWSVIQPKRMTVRDATGQTSEVKLAPTEGQVLGAMAAVGLVIALMTILISVLARKH